MRVSKTILLSLCFLLALISQGQERIIDTLEVQDQHVKLLAQWKNDSITLRRLLYPVVYDTAKNRKWLRDSTFTPTGEHISKHIEIVKTAAQNCYSYALELCFNHHDFSPPINLDHDTWIGTDDFLKIIEDSFEMINRYPTKPKRNMKMEIEDGTIVVFRNKSEKAHHAFFFNEGVFYSKNGAWKAIEYTKMIDIFKRYWDSQYFELYRMK